MNLPDRFGDLVKRLEAGETVTQKDLDRLATLQLLDFARIGEDFAREQLAMYAESEAAMKEMANAG